MADFLHKMSLQNFFLFLVSFITLMIIIIQIIFPHGPKKKKLNLPPSPRKLPIIGNLHQISSHPHRSLHAISQKHGPIMLLHLGSVPTLVASSSEAAQEILKTQDLSFCSRPKFTIPGIITYGCRDITMSPYGEYWRQLKSIAVLHLLSNSRVKSFEKVREKEISRTIDILEKSCGSLVDLSALLLSLSNNIICTVVMGRTYDGSKLVNLLNEFLDLLIVFSVGSLVPWLGWMDRVTGVVGRAEKHAKEFDEFLEGLIEDHVNKKRSGGHQSSDDQEECLIGILLDLQKDNTVNFKIQRDSIKALILDIFAGGTDTIATTVEMAISELIRHPLTMKKLQQEVTEVAKGRPMIIDADLEKISFLTAVVKETLRLHPPAPLLTPRVSTQDVKLMGYDIPKGTQVFVNAWAIGRDPALWEDPNEFRPERFLNNSITYKGQQFNWLPFGAGRRECPGIQFAVVATELVLANIVYRYDLALPDGFKDEDLDMNETCGIVVRRAFPLMVIPSARF
uniref:cytochrome P450 Tp4149-like n=1 Tax=Erigeron canadensis TaxID=72917 RepID=UPI001CB963CB|nr:cytochrome P450 Tp4149-like [Erigeron canadensis]